MKNCVCNFFTRLLHHHDLGSWVRLHWFAHDEAPGPYIMIPQYRFNKTKQHTHTVLSLECDISILGPRRLQFLATTKSSPSPKPFFWLFCCCYATTQVHHKILIEIAIVLSTNSGSFPSNSHVSATFSILLRFGEFWIPTNCEKFNADGSLMGRTNLDKSVW